MAEIEPKETVVTERVVERPTTTVVEKRSGTGLITLILLLGIVAVIAYYLVALDQREDAKAVAVTEAARSVGTAADSVGDAARDVATGTRPE